MDVKCSVIFLPRRKPFSKTQIIDQNSIFNNGYLYILSSISLVISKYLIGFILYYLCNYSDIFFKLIVLFTYNISGLIFFKWVKKCPGRQFIHSVFPQLEKISSNDIFSNQYDWVKSNEVYNFCFYYIFLYIPLFKFLNCVYRDEELHLTYSLLQSRLISNGVNEFLDSLLKL